MAQKDENHMVIKSGLYAGCLRTSHFLLSASTTTLVTCSCALSWIMIIPEDSMPCRLFFNSLLQIECFIILLGIDCNAGVLKFH